MFKKGALILSEKEKYVIYEVEAPRFYRLDICKAGAPFHTKPEDVVYSEYRKKKTYVFGDVTIKQRMLELKEKLQSMPLPDDTETGWVDGHYQSVTTHGTEEDAKYIVTQLDGVFFSEQYQYLDNVLFLGQASGMSTMTLIPINSTEYKANDLVIKGITVTEAPSPYRTLSELRSMHNIRHLDDKDYGYIHSVEEAREYIAKIYEAKRRAQKIMAETGDVTKVTLIGVDTETTGLDFTLYGKDELVGIIISTEENEARYFGFRHKQSYNLPLEFLDELMVALIECQEFEVAHNKKFEHKVFFKYGYDLCIKHDSMLASFLLNPRIARGVHALKTLEYERSGNKYLEFEDIFLDPKNINFAYLPEDLIVAYACPDADNTRRVWKWKFGGLPNYEHKIYEVECELADIKSEQEYWGFRINMDDLIDGKENCQYTIDLLEKLIHRLTNQNDLKITSNDVLSDLLYNKMRCPVLMETKSKKPSTSSKALDKLSHMKLKEPGTAVKSNILDKHDKIVIKASELNEAKYPVVSLLSAHRKFVKLKTAFYNRIENGSIGERGEHQSCSRYYSWINQNGAETGRQSSPLHQFPVQIKGDILADSEEHQLVDTDFAQVELRLIFSLAGETELIEMAKDINVDIHRAIGSIISGKPVWAIDAYERKIGKSRNFGVIYMISAQGLAVQMFGAGANKEEIAICEKSIAEFYAAFKRIGKYVRDNRTKVLKEGKMITRFGRVRYFDQLSDPDLPKDKRESLIRQANNLPVQGTAADIMKMCENNIQRYIKNKGWDKLVDTPQGKYPLVRLMLSAHDEALVSAHISIPLEEILEMKKVCMELPIGNIMKLVKQKLKLAKRHAKKVRKARDEKERQLVIDCKEKSHILTDQFAPLYVASSITDNWEEGHSGDYEVPRGLRDRLIDNYYKTGKSAFSYTLGRKQELMDAINSYRDEELVGYMEGLIAKVGLNAEAIAKEVVHPSLTHDLIGRFPQSKEHEKVNGKLSHVDHILYSVNDYLKSRGEDGVGKVAATIPNRVSEKKESETTADALAQITELTETLYDIDPQGNPIYDSEDEGDEDVETGGFLTYEDELDFIASFEKVSGDKVYVWEFVDAEEIAIDITTLNPVQSQEIINHIWNTYQDPKGYFSIKLITTSGIIDSTMRCEKMDYTDITKMIQQLSGVIKQQVS